MQGSLDFHPFASRFDLTLRSNPLVVLPASLSALPMCASSSCLSVTQLEQAFGVKSLASLVLNISSYSLGRRGLAEKSSLVRNINS
jgi:hypothetical protein